MTHCKKMKRPCTCGKLFLYDGTGQVRELDSAASFLSDGEIRKALTVMLQEWRRRCSDFEAGAMRAQMH